MIYNVYYDADSPFGKIKALLSTLWLIFVVASCLGLGMLTYIGIFGEESILIGGLIGWLYIFIYFYLESRLRKFFAKNKESRQ